MNLDKLIMNVITENINDIINIDNNTLLFDLLSKKLIISGFEVVSEFESKKDKEKISMFFNKIDKDFRTFIVINHDSIAISKMKDEDFNLNYNAKFEFDKIDLNEAKLKIINESLITVQNAFLYKNKKELNIWPAIFTSDDEYMVEFKDEKSYFLNLSNKNIKLDLIISNGILENKTEGDLSAINDLEELRDIIKLKTDYDFLLPYKIIDNIQKKSNAINQRIKNGI